MDRGSDRGGLTTRWMTAMGSHRLQWVLEVFRRAGWKGKTALILATWFGAGLMPRASGTFGSLAAVPLVLVGWLGTAWSLSALASIIVIALWSAHRAQELLGKEDPSEVVIDEAAGMAVTLFLVPLSWTNIFLGFFIFRVFDVVKPWPVHQMERLHGGLGIVADDLMAGIYAHLVMRVFLWFAA